MDNILEFTPRVKPIELLATPEVEAALDAQPGRTEPVAKTVEETVANEVVRALGFYALQGNDGGELARKALRGMGFVVLQELPGKGALIAGNS